MKSFGLTFAGPTIQFDVAAASGRADSGQLDIDFEELVEDLAPVLRKASSALAIFVDEMQDLDPQLLSTLLSAQHRAGQKDWPFYVIGAGLPSLPSTLSASRSYAERLFNYRSVAPLDVVAAREALERPANDRGVHYDDRAAREIVEASGGYPYFIQTYGQAAWEIAVDRVVTVADARDAISMGNGELDMGFFPARWERATPAEREYLQAMSAMGENSAKTADIATRLGTKQTSLSPARQSLIRKGIIYAPERGLVAFTVPNMAQFVRRQVD